MFSKEDNTYHEIREKSLIKWLDQMSSHDDIEVRSGVGVSKSYLNDLKKKIKMLESKNALKDKYLKKLKSAKHNKSL